MENNEMYTFFGQKTDISRLDLKNFYEQFKNKQCFCVGPDKCNDISCKLVQENRNEK